MAWTSCWVSFHSMRPLVRFKCKALVWMICSLHRPRSSPFSLSHKIFVMHNKLNLLTGYLVRTSSANPYLSKKKKIRIEITWLGGHTLVVQEPYRLFSMGSSWFPRFRKTAEGCAKRQESRMTNTSMELLPRSTKSPLNMYGLNMSGRPFWNTKTKWRICQFVQQYSNWDGTF